jgi:hypothetical protein
VLGAYLLRALDVVILSALAWFAGVELRRWLLPRFTGAPAHLATVDFALALMIWPAELLGSFGLFELTPFRLLLLGAAIGLSRVRSRHLERGE